MTIRRPTPSIDASDAAILRLLDKLLSEHSTPGNHNRAPDRVTLTDREAAALAVHLTALTESRDFIESLFFMEGLYGFSKTDPGALRAIFARGIRRNGRSATIHSTAKWHQFLARMGVLKPRWPSQNVRPMPFDTFLEMESRLLKHLNISEPTAALLLTLCEQQRERHENIPKLDFSKIYGERLDQPYEPEEPLFRKIKQQITRLRDKVSRDMSGQQLAGLTIIIVDTSVMFQTRDWGVAGTISQMAGAVPLMLKK